MQLIIKKNPTELAKAAAEFYYEAHQRGAENAGSVYDCPVGGEYAQSLA